MTPRTLRLLGIPIHQVTTSEALALAQQFMGEAGLHQIATVNPEFIMTARRDAEFHRILNRAELCLPDGVGLLLAGRWLGKPFPERVAGSDFVYHLAQLAATHGWRLFLLGAAHGVAEEAAAVFQERFPGLIIAGTFSGSPEPADNEAIVERINESQAGMLYVAFGAPKQDKWISRNREALGSVRVAMGVGGSLDFVTGRASRAPRWVQQAGLEWLHRLLKEPWRWRRMLALPEFAARIVLAGADTSKLRETRGRK